MLGLNCRQACLTRASVLREMMEEFANQCNSHHAQTIIVDRPNAEDEDLIKIHKELGYERYMTTYLMRTAIIS